MIFVIIGTVAWALVAIGHATKSRETEDCVFATLYGICIGSGICWLSVQ